MSTLCVWRGGIGQYYLNSEKLGFNTDRGSKLEVKKKIANSADSNPMRPRLAELADFLSTSNFDL